MNQNIQEYAKLADISNRTVCPRCEGYGFIHSSVDKHDRPTSQRCKKCIDCSVCETAGVTFGVVKCLRCNAKGFYHNPNAPALHQFSDFVKCFDCLECKDCLGLGVLDEKRIEALRQLFEEKKVVNLKGAALRPGLSFFPQMIPDTAPFTKGNPWPTIYHVDPDLIHPHQQGIFGTALTPEVIEIINTVQPPKQFTYKHKDLMVNVGKQTIDCPKCLGAGYKHESSAKHDKKAQEKCKHCTTCKGCNGSGSVTGKKACTNCQMRGFVHSSTEREHDVPQNLRCFFCKNCQVCKGTGLESVRVTGLVGRKEGVRNSMESSEQKRFGNLRDSILPI